jgi:hypothetical protein
MPKGIPKAGYRKGRRVSTEQFHAIEIACKRLSTRALEILEEAMNDKGTDPRYRIMAAKEILDRGWGKPKQSTESTVNVNASDNFVQALREARARANQMVIEAAQGAPALVAPITETQH